MINTLKKGLGKGAAKSIIQLKKQKVSNKSSTKATLYKSIQKELGPAPVIDINAEIEKDTEYRIRKQRLKKQMMLAIHKPVRRK